MSYRFLSAVLAVGAVVWLTPAFAAGQATTASTAPRTPWGDPDLQGTYTNKTITPLQRPEELAGKEFLTDEDAAVLQDRTAQARSIALPGQATPAPTTSSGSTGAPRSSRPDEPR